MTSSSRSRGRRKWFSTLDVSAASRTGLSSRRRISAGVLRRSRGHTLDLTTASSRFTSVSSLTTAGDPDTSRRNPVIRRTLPRSVTLVERSPLRYSLLDVPCRGGRLTVPDTLFTNARLVLGGFAELQASFDVLVKGAYIHTVSPRPLDRGDAAVIDVAGRTLMPGLIDAHCHITGLSLSPKNIAYPAGEIATAAASYLRNSLMDGFTTIREAGGADYSIAHLLAQGTIIGPRLFYSGRALTQTGGGADFRTPNELLDPCGHISPFSVMSVIADGVDEVRKAAREELRRGASQIKLFSSGGVVFPSDSHATLYEFSAAELEAAVEE